MRYLAVLITAALTGCAYNVTLYPRGGGDQATGTFDVGSQVLRVTLRGEEYSGRAVAGTSMGLGAVGTKPMVMSGTTNQRSALLEGKAGVIRCEWAIAVSGGNGVCVDSAEKTYDLSIKPQ